MKKIPQVKLTPLDEKELGVMLTFIRYAVLKEEPNNKNLTIRKIIEEKMNLSELELSEIFKRIASKGWIKGGVL